MTTLAERLIAASEVIFKATRRDRSNVLWVEVSSPLYEAIQRGEFRAFGIEPGSGVLVNGGSWLRLEAPPKTD